MGTWIKPGFWVKKDKYVKQALNLDDYLREKFIPITQTNYDILIGNNEDITGVYYLIIPE